MCSDFMGRLKYLLFLANDALLSDVVIECVYITHSKDFTIIQRQDPKLTATRVLYAPSNQAAHLTSDSVRSGSCQLNEA